jgi:hypothetical protein
LIPAAASLAGNNGDTSSPYPTINASHSNASSS